MTIGYPISKIETVKGSTVFIDKKTNTFPAKEEKINEIIKIMLFLFNNFKSFS